MTQDHAPGPDLVGRGPLPEADVEVGVAHAAVIINAVIVAVGVKTAKRRRGAPLKVVLDPNLSPDQDPGAQPNLVIRRSAAVKESPAVKGGIEAVRVKTKEVIAAQSAPQSLIVEVVLQRDPLKMTEGAAPHPSRTEVVSALSPEQVQALKLG